jgi:hypothetical protein
LWCTHTPLAHLLAELVDHILLLCLQPVLQVDLLLIELYCTSIATQTIRTETADIGYMLPIDVTAAAIHGIGMAAAAPVVAPPKAN